MRHLLALVLSLLLTGGGLVAVAPSALAYTPDNEELTFLALINDYRGQNGLTALSLNPALGDAAKFHSQDMAENNYFEHTALDGTTADQNVKNFGYAGSATGENIAAGMETAAEAMAGWQSSPEHNAGMLNPAFNEIGIGRYYSANSAYGWYWTTTFGGNNLPGGATEINDNGAPAPDGNGNGNGNGNRDGNGGRNGNGDGGTTTVVAEPGANISTDISDNGTETTNVENGDGQVLESRQEAPSGTLNADGSTVSANDDGTGPAVGDGEVTTYDDINTGGVSGDSVNYDQSVTPPTTETTAPPAETAPPADTAAAPPADTAAPPADTAAAPPVDTAAAPPAGQQTTTTTTTADGTVTETYSENIQEGDGNAQELGGDSNTSSSSDSGTVSTDSTTTNTADPTLTSGAEAPPADAAAAPEAAPAAAPATGSGPPAGVYLDPAQAGLGCWDYTDWYEAQLAYENGGGLAADPAYVNAMDPNWDGVACEDLMVY